MSDFEKMAEKCRQWLKTPDAILYLGRWAEATVWAEQAAAFEVNHPDDYEDMNVLAFCQRMWEALPDVPEIRSHQFFTLCDFAEFYCEAAELDKVEVQKNEAGLVNYLGSKH